MQNFGGLYQGGRIEWKEKNKRKRDYRGKKKVGLTGYYRRKGGRI